LVAMELKETLDLAIPNLAELDLVFRHPDPFVLWPIGDQSLLCHWLDYAVNQGATRVRFYAADRPHRIREALKHAQLWPLDTEVISLGAGEAAPEDAITIHGLPDQNASRTPENGWDLLKWRAELETIWLGELHQDPMGELLSIGSNCKIHPDCQLHPPYFIGDDVFIGPGCEVGPHAVISQGAILAGANRVLNSHVMPRTFLGAVTELDGCLIDGGKLFNLRHQVRLDHLESHLGASLSKPSHQEAPSLRERILAFRLQWKFRAFMTASKGTRHLHDGRMIPDGDPRDFSTRLNWLKLVITGKMRLFGVLPRSREEMESIDPTWRSALEHATVGVFSYADCHGCHSPLSEEEVIHAVYQAEHPAEEMETMILEYVRQITSPADFS
jgi:carbonic anhydrase/acetyltransferase-like protein (isoleucine patch superfamily)